MNKNNTSEEEQKVYRKKKSKPIAESKVGTLCNANTHKHTLSSLESKNLSLATSEDENTITTNFKQKPPYFKQLAYKYNEKELLDDGQEIIDLISPKFEKLKFKEKQLENLSRKANEYLMDYEKNNEELQKLIKKYKSKKEKIEKFAVNLSTIRTNLKKREHTVSLKERQLNDYEESLLQEEKKLNLNKEKFDIYVHRKSSELLNKAEDFKKNTADVTKLQKLLENKDQEIKEKHHILLEEETKTKIKMNTVENEKYDLEIKKKEFELTKDEFELYSGEIVKKYHDMKKIQEEVNKNKKELEVIDAEIKSKNEELRELEKRNRTTNSTLNQRQEELDKRLSEVDKREREVNLLKQDLDDKLLEISIKLQDIKKLTKELKQKESVLKIKQNIDKDLDLKLSEIEMNETLNQKKFFLQQKMLNEEISRRVNHSSTLVNQSQSKFYR